MCNVLFCAREAENEAMWLCWLVFTERSSRRHPGGGTGTGTASGLAWVEKQGRKAVAVELHMIRFLDPVDFFLFKLLNLILFLERVHV